MKNKLFWILSVLLYANNLCAQSALPREAWMQPIEALFAGLNQGDSALARTAFLPGATLATVVPDEAGNAAVRRNDLGRLLTGIGTPRKETWTEPIWNVSAQQHGPFVQVWCEYAFYVDKRLSHCGIDTFQLVRDKAGNWKIMHLTDTRQQQGCQVPAAVADQFR
jgi:hypothetical protein